MRIGRSSLAGFAGGRARSPSGTTGARSTRPSTTPACRGGSCVYCKSSATSRFDIRLRGEQSERRASVPKNRRRVHVGIEGGATNDTFLVVPRRAGGHRGLAVIRGDRARAGLSVP